MFICAAVARASPGDSTISPRWIRRGERPAQRLAMPYDGNDEYRCRKGKGQDMSTTLTVDEELLAEAQRLTGVTEKSEVIRIALKALIERESAPRLARLGGSEPDLIDIPRRRAESA
jgi:Arc/MetJ family transcription regulator